MIDAPSIVLIDLPVLYRGSSLLLDRFYPCVLETEAEEAEFKAWLIRPRPGAVPPSLFDRRPSQIEGHAVLIAQYRPAEKDWPWVTVCRWPVESPYGNLLARGCYTTEAFWSEEAMMEFCAELLATLGRERALEVTMISAAQLPPCGSA